MKTHAISASRRRAGGVLAGFTLVELLVVVGIMAILASMLIPSLGKAITDVRRRACRAKLKQIYTGCYNYMQGTPQQLLPTTRPSPAEWGDMQKGNPGGLWKLVERGYCPRDAFLCPEASDLRGWRAPTPDEISFMYISGQEVSTLSYSYVSTVRDKTWTTNLADKMTLSNLEPSFVIVADQSPRCIPGQTKIFDYKDTNLNGSAGDGEDTKELTRLGFPKSKLPRWKNTRNHDRMGQNVVKMDGAAVWLKDPNAPYASDPTKGNDIYCSDLTKDDEGKGKRGGGKDSGGKDLNDPSADPFVLP